MTQSTGPRPPRRHAKTGLRRHLHLLVAVVLALGGILTMPVTAYAADPTASISIQKSANTSTVVPGQTFDYTIQVQCTSGTVAGCVNAQVTDELPEYVSLNGTVTVAGSTNNPTVDDGPPIVVTFNDDLGGGAVGLAPGNVIDITIPVKIDDDIPPTASGQDLVNTATITADNANTKSDDATVTPDVEATLAAETTKEFSSDGDPAVPGTPLTAALTGKNTSNVPVETLVITDPPAPGVTPNPFTYLGIADPPADVTMPDGAETVQISLYVPGRGWVDGTEGPPPPSYPDDVDPAEATGIRWTFASDDGADIPPGATANVGINLEQRDNVADLTEATTVTNVADTTVSDGTDDATSEPASDTYRIRPAEVDVIAGKTFDPDTVTAGDPSTVTLTGTNNSEDPLTTMTITEPAAGTPNHFADGGFNYTPSESNVEFPTGATAGTVTFVCDGTPGDPQSLADGDPLPAPPADCDPVTGFSVTFTGSIEPGAEATVPFEVTTADDQPQDELTRRNVVQVDGSNDNASATNRATDEITTIIKRLDVETTKKITPSTIPAWPGQIVTAELSGRVLPFPDSTTPATQIIVQDPATIPDPNQWYDSFDPAGVVATPVPACATGSVFSTVDGSTWVPVPGMQDIPSGIYNAPFPQDVQDNAIGIRFVYTAEPAGGACSGGFPPGTSVAPNISYSLEGDVPNEAASFTNCAAATATSPDADRATSDPACDTINLVPYGPGTVDPVDKTWDVDLLNARSQEQAGATISWSTAGFTGIGRVQIIDPTDFSQALPDSVLDAFDLVRIDPVTPALDPLLTYDQVLDVRLFRLPAGSTDPAAGSWQDATDDRCPAACDGTFPGYTLTAEERASTIAFELDYIESPTREDRLSAGAPPVGSGVAASTGNNRRLHPVFQLRDELRSNPDVPITADRLYNTATEGEILNSVQLEPFRRVFDRDPIGRFTTEDTIELVDVPVTADATKTWTGGPLGIPEPAVAQNQWPTARVTITGTNTTPAKVDELAIADPTDGTHPFDAFNLIDFVSITPPSTIGASDLAVTLDRGGTATTYSRDQALALTEADLVDVTGFSVDYTGRINASTNNPKPTATIVFDTRLRTESRSTGRPPQPGATINNAVTTTASDLVDYPNVSPNTQDATAFDDIQLVGQGIDVVAGKSFNPATLTEPDDGPVTATISGQPVAPGDGGPLPPSRAVKLVLTDTAPTFWNAYDLVGLNPITFVTPVNQVQVDAYVGGTWSISRGQPVLTGGHWELGTATTNPNVTLPGGVTAAQVQGLRYTFTRADGANWENPANPVQTATFQVERSDTLNTGDPVHPDLPQYDPAPGETAPGVTTNLVTADVTSSDVDGNDVPLTATDDEDATITYRHATNEVTVEKVGNRAAGSLVAPGADFPYTLTVTNSGDSAIVDPVITDRLPTDADGPQVVIADNPRLTYAITGGTGMPTDPALITVTGSPDLSSPTQITWDFPTGSTLPVEATYTITFYVHTRPGLAADTDITNEFGITADRPWDRCTNGGSNAVEQNGECATDASNSVESAGAVSVAKQVKAEGSDALGVVLDPLATFQQVCVADGDGFYSRPCIPIAEPGGDITWRWHFTNAGNRPLDRILGIDRLPRATDDQLATAPLARGSQWKPLLTGDRPTLADGDGTLRVYYTTSTTGWCDGPVGHDGSQLCDADDPNVRGGAGLDWELWPAGQTLDDLGVDPADVTGLATDFAPDTGDLAPADTFDVDVPMVAPAYSPADTPNTTGRSATTTNAYNTVGTSARVDSTAGRAAAAADVGVLDAGDPYTLTTEPPRVGVGLARGGFTLLKRVAGDGAKYAPDTFNVTISCTSAGEDVPLPAAVANQTVSANTPVRVYDLPYHATCTLADGDGNGETSSNSPQTVTVQSPPVTNFETATLVNTYAGASLSIAKDVTDSALDQDGNPIAYGPFTFTVDCIFLGEPVEANEPMTFELSSDSDPVMLTGLPPGAECTATESDAGSADSTASEGTTGVGSDDEETSTGDSSIDLTLTPDGEDPVVTNTVVFTNTFPTGQVVITKVIAGTGADVSEVGPFTVHMTCVAANDSTRTVYDADHELTTDRLTWTVTDLYVDSTCEVTEPETGGATTSVVSPAGPFPVTAAAADSPVQVSVVNTFDPAQPDDDSASGDDLASTGGPSLVILGVGALLLIAGGTLIAARGRRR